MNNYSCYLTLTTAIDPDPIEVTASSEHDARQDLQRQFMSWDRPEVLIDTSSTTSSDADLLEIFEQLDEDDSDFYGGDGVEEALMEPIEGEKTLVHIRWSASFEFRIQGDDHAHISKQVEDFARRSISINGIKVENVQVELFGD